MTAPPIARRLCIRRSLTLAREISFLMERFTRSRVIKGVDDAHRVATSGRRADPTDAKDRTMTLASVSVVQEAGPRADLQAGSPTDSPAGAHAHSAEQSAERDLVRRAKGGDRSALSNLYDLHAPAVLRYLVRRTGSEHTAEDITADVFTALVQNVRGYEDRGLPLRAWLFRVATHRVGRWARRQRLRTFVGLPADVPQGGASTSGEKGGGVLRHLLSLPPDFQSVLSLYHLEGLSVAEVARILGTPEGTVRSRLSRARDALRKRLESEETSS